MAMHIHDYSLPDHDSAAQDAFAHLKREIPSADRLFADPSQDADTAFGAPWYPLLAFSNSDFLTARLAAAGAKLPGAWIIEFATGVIAPADAAQWAGSFAAAITFGLEACQAEALLPDGIECDPRRNTLTAKLGGKLLFHVFKMQKHEPRPENLLKRARSTLVGFRKAQNPVLELHKRLARWQGMDRLGLDGLETREKEALRIDHLPVASEWLWNAKSLLTKLELPNDTNAQQCMLATIFGAKTYNALVHSSADDLASLAGPWRVVVWDGKGKDMVYVRPDPYSAFILFTEKIRDLSKDWSAPTLDMDAGLSWGALHLMVIDSPYSEEPDRAKAFVSLAQLAHCTPASGTTHAAVLAGLDADPQDVEARLANVFKTNLSRDERLSANLASFGASQIAEHGEWCFAESGENFSATTPQHRLHILKVDQVGNLITRTFIPCYKGGIGYDEDTERWVFFSDYDFSSAVAAVPGLPDQLAEALKSFLKDRRLRYDGMNDRDRTHVANLIKRYG